MKDFKPLENHQQLLARIDRLELDRKSLIEHCAVMGADLEFLKQKLSECEKWVAIAGGITCPDCDDNGSYVFADSHGTETQCQCEFCHKCPQSKFNVQKKSKQRGPQE